MDYGQYRRLVESFAKAIDDSGVPLPQLIFDVIQLQMGGAEPYTFRRLNKVMRDIQTILNEERIRKAPPVSFVMPSPWRPD